MNDLIDARTLGRVEVERDLGGESVARDDGLRVSVGGKGGSSRHCEVNKVSVEQRLHPLRSTLRSGQTPAAEVERANAMTHFERAGWL